MPSDGPFALAGALAALVLLASAGVATAQPAPDLEAPPTVAANTLYAVRDPTGSGQHRLQGNGTSAGEVTHSAFAGKATYEISMPHLPHDVHLDGTGKATAYVGGFLGNVEVSMSLSSDGEALATGAAKAVELRPTATYNEVSWDLPLNATMLRINRDLTWRVTVDGVASSVSLGMGGATQSRIVLPVVPTPPPPGIPRIDLPWTLPFLFDAGQTTAPRSVDYAFHWDGAREGIAAYSTNRTEGTLRLLVTDADGRILFDEGTFTDGASEQEFEAAATGNWTTLVQLRGFVGQYSIFVGNETEAPEPGWTPPTPATPSPPQKDPAGPEGGDPELETVPTVRVKGSPGAGFGAILGLLAFGVLLRRRVA